MQPQQDTWLVDARHPHPLGAGQNTDSETLVKCTGYLIKASLVAEMVKNPPAMWETWVRSLGREDDLEEGMATHSSIFVWRIPMDRGAWWAKVHGVMKSWTRMREQAHTRGSLSE